MYHVVLSDAILFIGASSCVVLRYVMDLQFLEQYSHCKKIPAWANIQSNIGYQKKSSEHSDP